MILNQLQISYLFSFTSNHGVQYYDVQVELVDHLASKIEAEMEAEKTLSFLEALNKVYASFGPRGFKDVMKEKKNATQAEVRRIANAEIKQLFTFPKVIITATVCLAFYTLGRLLPPPVSYYSLIIFFCILTAYQLITAYKQKKKSTKKILFLEVGGKMAILLISGPGQAFCILSMIDVATTWHVVAVIPFVLFAFVLQVSAYNQYIRVRKEAQIRYPDAFE